MALLLSALEVFYPTPSTWELIETWVEKAVSVGQRFGVGDLLIGSIAAEKSLPVWSLDSDFARMAGFGWLTLHHL
jgi:predicted nucleic acid-binding protein